MSESKQNDKLKKLDENNSKIKSEKTDENNLKVGPEKTDDNNLKVEPEKIDDNNLKVEPEKLEDNNLENVSGGFYGRDWSKKWKDYYDQLGIIHTKHALRNDEYYRINFFDENNNFCEKKKITSKEAYKLVEELLNNQKNIKL